MMEGDRASPEKVMMEGDRASPEKVMMEGDRASPEKVVMEGNGASSEKVVMEELVIHPRYYEYTLPVTRGVYSYGERLQEC